MNFIKLILILLLLNIPSISKTEINDQSRIEVFFGKNTWKLSKESASYLDTLVIIINTNKDQFTNLKIDLIPMNCEEEYKRNCFIGVQRCKVVMDYLIIKGGFLPTVFSIKEPCNLSSVDCKNVGVVIELDPY